MIICPHSAKNAISRSVFTKTLIYIEYPIGNIHTATATAATATASTPD